MYKGKFKDIVRTKDGFLRGPFGSALKKSLFVPKDIDTYKVYEQGVILNEDKNIGNYYITKKYFDENLKRFEVHSKDFLVSCSGVNYGKIFQLEGIIEKGVINQAILRIRLNNEIVDDNYFLYYFKSYISKVITKGTGDSTIPNFPSMDYIKNIEIELPELETQKRIGFIIKSIDKKIELNNKINTELEATAKTIYDYWFLQFEFPNEEGKPYKSSGGKMVYNQELKREIPEGWEVKNISSIIENTKSGDWGKDTLEKNYVKEVSCIRGADFPSVNGYAQLKAPKRYILNKNSYKVLTSNDLIIEISGGSPTQSTGRICYMNDITLKRFSTDIITSNFCKAISLINDEYKYWFYIFWNKLYDNGIFFQYEGKTTGIKNLLFDLFCDDYKIILPKDEIILAYHNLVKSYFDKIQQNLLENQELISLRDFLLPLLMNGQVGFNDSDEK